MPRTRLLLAVLLAGCGQPAPPYAGKSVADLEAMLRSDDPGRQVQGAYGLGQLEAEAAPAVPALRQALHSAHVLLKQNAALALARIGPAARDAVPELTGLLDDPAWQVRRQAALALGAIGPDARTALPALERLAGDADDQVKQAVSQAVARINQR